MYCVADDVLEEFYLPLRKQVESNFTKVDDDTGDIVPDTEGLEAFIKIHIKRASDYVDTALCGWYVVPLALPVPSVINTITSKLASYFAVAQFSEQEDTAKDKKDTAMAMITGLLRSRAFPGLTPIDSGLIQGESNKRIYTDDLTREW